MDLHASANWWGLWWLALFAVLLLVTAGVPLRPATRTDKPDTAPPPDPAP